MGKIKITKITKIFDSNNFHVKYNYIIKNK